MLLQILNNFCDQKSVNHIFVCNNRVPAWTDRVLWRGPKDSPGELFWYGRAELKQSDHRPVLAIIDVEISRIVPDKREAVFSDTLEGAGPPDGSVLLQVQISLAYYLSCFLTDFATMRLQSSMLINPVFFFSFQRYRIVKLLC